MVGQPRRTHYVQEVQRLIKGAALAFTPTNAGIIGHTIILLFLMLRGGMAAISARLSWIRFDCPQRSSPASAVRRWLRQGAVVLNSRLPPPATKRLLSSGQTIWCIGVTLGT